MSKNEEEEIEFETGSDEDFEFEEEGEAISDYEEDFDSFSEDFSKKKDIPLEEEEIKKYVHVHEAVIYDSIRKDIKNLQKYLFIDYNSTKEILKYYKWNFEVALNSYFSNGKEHIFGLIGLDTFLISNESTKIVECPCCMDDVQENSTLTISKCNHRFCVKCFDNYFKSKQENSSLKDVKCLNFNCKTVINKKIIQNFIQQDKSEKKRSLVENYITCNQKLKYCNTANCGFLTKLTTNDPSFTVFVECECGDNFCFNCKSNINHFPATCEHMQDCLYFFYYFLKREQKNQGRDSKYGLS